MKTVLMRCLTLLLCLCMVLPCVACGTSSELPDAQTNDGRDTEVLTEEETQYVPDIDVKNYDATFNILNIGYEKDMLYLEEGQGDTLTDAIYERGVHIKDHLGVDFELHSGDWIEYPSVVARTVQAGDDDYQLILTHVYQGICDLITSDLLYDMGELDAVNVDAPYWATTLMEDVKIDDKYLLGYSDFCLSNVHCLVFNKKLMGQYNMTAPYQLVRDHEWTLDTMMEMASLVAEDNGDQKWDNKDTYGIAGWGWIYLISFVTSSDLKIVDRDDTDRYVIAYENNKEKINSLIDKIFELYNADYSFLWKAWDNGNEDLMLRFENGQSLFQFYSSNDLPNLRGEDLEFGVLPYPKYDKGQDAYKSLNWNGMMTVPTSIKNPDMVGEVLELLAYYTAPVKVAYYEDMLGAKVSQAPEDAEMLDVIWDSQVSDVGLILCNSSQQMDTLVYMLPQMCESGNKTLASFMRANKPGAQRGLDELFGE